MAHWINRDYAGKMISKLEGASAEELNRAWQHCAIITRRHAGNFYYAFIFMPAEKRRAIQALYAFCRIGDDAVDEAQGDPRKIIELLRYKLDLCYNGRYIDELTLALSHAIKQYAFEKKHFEELLLGIEMDLSVNRYQTFDELRVYCYRVASTVGLLCLKIFDCDTENSRQYAESLGIGMQLTNILRDIREDIDRDRIYIPLEDLERFGVKESDLVNRVNNKDIKDLVNWEAERAGSFFTEAENCLTHGMRRKLYPAMIMGDIYREILNKIVADDKLEKRVELTRKDKIKIARRIITDGLR